MNPVNWYHHLTGHGDTQSAAPGPDAPYTKNVESGSDQPFPDLSTVPSPKIQTVTEAQRTALADNLVADRQNAHYVDEQSRADDAALPPMPALAGIPDTGAAPSAAPPPPVVDAQPIKHPVRRVRHHHAVAPDVDEAGGGTSRLAAGGGLGGSSGAISAPIPRENPEPEAVAAPLPAPSLPPVPAPAPVAKTAPMPAPQSPAEAPPAPEIAAVPAPVLSPATAPKTHNATKIAEIIFPAGTKDLPGDGTTALASAAASVTDGGTLRVVGHAPSGGDATAALSAYQDALARAQVVKAALVAKGVPSAHVVAEVSVGKVGPETDAVTVYRRD